MSYCCRSDRRENARNDHESAAGAEHHAVGRRVPAADDHAAHDQDSGVQKRRHRRSDVDRRSNSQGTRAKTRHFRCTLTMSKKKTRSISANVVQQ